MQDNPDLLPRLVSKIQTGLDPMSDWYSNPEWPELVVQNCWTTTLRAGTNLPGKQKVRYRTTKDNEVSRYTSDSRPTPLMRFKGAWINIRRALLSDFHSRTGMVMPTEWRAVCKNRHCSMIGCVNPNHMTAEVVQRTELQCATVDPEFLNCVEEIEFQHALGERMTASQFHARNDHYSEEVIRRAYVRANLTHLLDL